MIVINVRRRVCKHLIDDVVLVPGCDEDRDTLLRQRVEFFDGGVAAPRRAQMDEERPPIHCVEDHVVDTKECKEQPNGDDRVADDDREVIA